MLGVIFENLGQSLVNVKNDARCDFQGLSQVHSNTSKCEYVVFTKYYHSHFDRITRREL
jgi:hypothetical protein